MPTTRCSMSTARLLLPQTGERARRPMKAQPHQINQTCPPIWQGVPRPIAAHIGGYLAPRDGAVVIVRNGSPDSRPRRPWRHQPGRERASAIVATARLPAPPRGRHRRDAGGGICDLRRMIVHLIGRWPACWLPGIARELPGNRTGPGQRDQERRLPVRAVLAPCACPGREVPLTGGPPRDHGASGAPARQMPVPQHPEGPASRTRASAGEGGDASRRPCFRRSAGTAAAHRSRPGS